MERDPVASPGVSHKGGGRQDKHVHKSRRIHHRNVYIKKYDKLAYLITNKKAWLFQRQASVISIKTVNNIPLAITGVWEKIIYYARRNWHIFLHARALGGGVRATCPIAGDANVGIWALCPQKMKQMINYCTNFYANNGTSDLFMVEFLNCEDGAIHVSPQKWRPGWKLWVGLCPQPSQKTATFTAGRSSSHTRVKNCIEGTRHLSGVNLIRSVRKFVENFRQIVADARRLQRIRQNTRQFASCQIPLLQTFKTKLKSHSFLASFPQLLLWMFSA